MAENKKSSIVGKTTCHLLNVKQPERVAKRLKLSFQRTQATLHMLKSERKIDCSLSLLDISGSGAGLFTQELLLKGSAVEVSVREPQALAVKGIVAWSIPMQSGVQSARYPFRSRIQFVFENEQQKASVSEFIKRVNTDPLEAPKVVLPAEGAAASEAPASPAVEAAGEAPEAGAEAPASEEPAAETAPAAEDPPADSSSGDGESQAA